VLSAQQAKAAVEDIVTGDRPGHKAIKLFGKDSASSWTVAIMSGLKDMAKQIQLGRLNWVLRTAMPLRDDFKLYLNGKRLTPSKLDKKPIQKWVLGKDVEALDKPAPPEDQLLVDKQTKLPSTHRYGLTHGALGRVTGYMELHEDSLSRGKERFDRSHGFFVYVRGRLINIEDPLFGLQPLHHGTFARFRMVIHMDGLDAELRSSRESLKDGPSLTVARNILHASFNRARSWLAEHETPPEDSLPARLAQGPRSLTRRPVLALVGQMLKGKLASRYTTFPAGLDQEAKGQLLADLQARVDSDTGIVSEVNFSPSGPAQPLALFHVDSGALEINTTHPFVESYLEEFRSNETVNLVAWAEVISEAFLAELEVEPSVIQSFLKMRDELLRALTRHIRRPASQVSQDLLDAVHDQNQLEIELVNAFNVMGFEATGIGGSGEPDGTADAPLGAEGMSVARRYSLSLEAKSSETPGKKVSAKDVGVSRIARHRDAHNCDHAVVVGQDFPAKDEKAALVIEMNADRDNTGKTITLLRVADLARLVRLVALRGIGLVALRELFSTCSTPDESAEWIDALSQREPEKPPFKEILEAAWDLGKETPAEAVEFGQVTLVLRREKKIKIEKTQVRDLCRALSTLTPHVVVRESTVELNQRPDLVLEAVKEALTAFPVEEAEGAVFEP